MTPTSYQISLLQHTIGVRPDQRSPHRNHFVAGSGHQDMPHLERLVGGGLMEVRRSPAFLDDGDIVFAATEAGKATALQHLAPPPPPPKRNRYDEFLSADSDESLGAFLCGYRLPQFAAREVRGSFASWRRSYEYRMYRECWDSYRKDREIQGEWKPTKKEAKASYKSALAAHHAPQSKGPDRSNAAMLIGKTKLKLQVNDHNSILAGLIGEFNRCVDLLKPIWHDLRNTVLLCRPAAPALLGEQQGILFLESQLNIQLVSVTVRELEPRLLDEIDTNHVVGRCNLTRHLQLTLVISLGDSIRKFGAKQLKKLADILLVYWIERISTFGHISQSQPLVNEERAHRQHLAGALP